MKSPHVAPFTARVHHLQELEHYAYSCPHCKQDSRFSMEQVRNSHTRRSALLPYDIRTLFDASYPIANRHAEFYLEMHCAGCSAPVRLYFDACQKEAGGWEYYGSFVMELRSIPSAPVERAHRS